jgi:S1-C subfamily serine protease
MTLTEIKPHVEASRKRSSRGRVEVLVAGPDSDACRGGIRSGDIIAEINNSKIRSLQDIMKVLRLHDPHDPLLVLALNSNGWRCTALSFIKRLH